jgi:hypothetical protein
VVEEAGAFQSSIDAAIQWIIDHRDDIEAGIVTLTSINAPTCPGGVRGVVQVPNVVNSGRMLGVVDCDSTLEVPADDMEAFANGFTSISDLPIEP